MHVNVICKPNIFGRALKGLGTSLALQCYAGLVSRGFSCKAAQEMTTGDKGKLLIIFVLTPYPARLCPPCGASVTHDCDCKQRCLDLEPLGARASEDSSQQLAVSPHRSHVTLTVILARLLVSRKREAARSVYTTHHHKALLISNPIKKVHTISCLGPHT